MPAKKRKEAARTEQGLGKEAAMQNSGHEEEGKEFGVGIGGGADDESAFWNSRSAAEDETPSSHDKTVSPPPLRYKRCLSSRRSVSSFSAHHRLTMDVDNSLPNGPYLPCDIFGGSKLQYGTQNALGVKEHYVEEAD